MSEVERRVRLERLFTEHAGAVRAYALRRIDAGTADDIVSEVFVIAWRRLEEMPDDARPWLLGCARRVLANQRRGARRRQALLDRLTQSAAATNALPTFSDGVLAQALAKLSEPDRELLMLIAWEGLDPAQAAVVLGCSRGALGVRLHRARRRLAGAIARLEREEAAASREVEVLG